MADERPAQEDPANLDVTNRYTTDQWGQRTDLDQDGKPVAAEGPKDKPDGKTEGKVEDKVEDKAGARKFGR